MGSVIIWKKRANTLLFIDVFSKMVEKYSSIHNFKIPTVLIFDLCWRIAMETSIQSILFLKKLSLSSVYLLFLFAILRVECWVLIGQYENVFCSLIQCKRQEIYLNLSLSFEKRAHINVLFLLIRILQTEVNVNLNLSIDEKRKKKVLFIFHRWCLQDIRDNGQVNRHISSVISLDKFSILNRSLTSTHVEINYNWWIGNGKNDDVDMWINRRFESQQVVLISWHRSMFPQFFFN